VAASFACSVMARSRSFAWHPALQDSAIAVAIAGSERPSGAGARFGKRRRSIPGASGRGVLPRTVPEARARLRTDAERRTGAIASPRTRERLRVRLRRGVGFGRRSAAGTPRREPPWMGSRRPPGADSPPESDDETRRRRCSAIPVSATRASERTRRSAAPPRRNRPPMRPARSARDRDPDCRRACRGRDTNPAAR